jgi:hypothetical protein
MKRLYDLVTVRKISSWFISVSIILFILAILIYLFFDRYGDIPVLGFIIIVSFMFGIMLIFHGIILKTICNDFSDFMKSYNDNEHKK